MHASLAAFRDLLSIARSAGTGNVIVAQHLTTDELGSTPLPGHEQLAKVAEASHARIVQLGRAFKASLERGERPFRDDIHPSEAGRAIVADVLLEEIVGVANLDQPPRPPG